MESKQIVLSTYSPKSGGYGVHVSQLSGEVLNLFKPQLGLDEHITKTSTRSERLKRTNTLESARSYIDRFYSLPLQDQVNAISNKSIKLVSHEPKPKQGVMVATRVQYYRLSLNGKDLGTSYRLDEIANLRKVWPNLSVNKSVAKEMLFEKDEFELFKHFLTTLASIPKGKIKSDIASQFKGIVTKRK
jgi:hypothetical protein